MLYVCKGHAASAIMLHEQHNTNEVLFIREVVPWREKETRLPGTGRSPDCHTTPSCRHSIISVRQTLTLVESMV